MKKTVFIFASVMIVGMHALDAADGEMDIDLLVAEGWSQLSAVKRELGIMSTTLGTHTKQIENVCHKADNVSQRVVELEKKVCEVEENQKVQGLFLYSLPKQIGSSHSKANNALKIWLELEQKIYMLEKKQNQDAVFVYSLLNQNELYEPLLSDEDDDEGVVSSASSEGTMLSSGDVDCLRTAMGILYQRTHTSEKKVQKQQAHIERLTHYIALLKQEGYLISDDDSVGDDSSSPSPSSPRILLHKVDPETGETRTSTEPDVILSQEFFEKTGNATV